MRPITMMMAQKKPEQKQGTALSFSDVIPSKLPAQGPNQCIFYGMSTQGINPSFDNPQTVNPVEGIATVGDDTLTIPPLYGIEFHNGTLDNVSWVEDGVTHYAVADTYEPCVLVDGVYKSRNIQRIGIKVFDGTENIALWATNPNQTAFYFVTSAANMGMKANSDLISNSFIFLSNYADIRSGAIGIGCGSYNLYFGLSTSDLPTQTAEAFKDLLVAKNVVGTPVTVDYILGAPVVTLGDPVFVSTKQGTTNINSSSAVQGQIKASVLKKKIGDN